jgi:hypothetical protein
MNSILGVVLAWLESVVQSLSEETLRTKMREEEERLEVTRSDLSGMD